MPKWKVMIGLPVGDGSLRNEVMGWVIECQRVGHQDDEVKALLADELLVAPVQAFPTNIARNRLVETARHHKCDLLFMADSDSWPQEGWFKAALQFMTSQPVPSVLACPYVTGGSHEEQVLVFEFTQTRRSPMDVMPATFGLTRVDRQDAARRRGIERVASLGTHCVVYDMRCFDRIAKPYFAYQFNQEQTQTTETEDCWAHRLMFNAGIPLFVAWDFWTPHHKGYWATRPLPLPIAAVPEFYRQQAEGHVRYHREPQPPLAVPEPKMAGGWNLDRVEEMKKASEQAGRVAPGKEPGRNGAGGGSSVTAPPPSSPFSGSPALDRMHAATPVCASPEYAADAVRIGPRPTLKPQNRPMDLLYSASFGLSVEGWMTDEELQALAMEVSRLRSGDEWAEVGVWKGRSLSACVLSAPEGVVIHAIDRWDGAHLGPVAAESVFGEFLSLRDELRRLRPGVRTQARRKGSVEAAPTYQDGRFAGVFLDAGQDVESVRANVTAWLPKVRPDGVLCGHDAFAPGTTDVLTELLGEGVTIGPGSLWWYRVPQPKAKAPAPPAVSAYEVVSVEA